MAKPFSLPHRLSIYFDLSDKYYHDLKTMSYLEMFELWLDRANKNGFEYEDKTKGKVEIKRDYLYFLK